MPFLDSYDCVLDELTYIMGETEVEIEIYNTSNPKKHVLICQGNSLLHNLVNNFNKNVTFTIPLVSKDGNDGGEIKVKGFVTEVDTSISKLLIFLYFQAIICCTNYQTY